MRILAAVSLSFLLCAAAAAQEYGRDSAGTVDMTTKRSTSLFSGSLSATSMGGFGATVGGTAVKDRVWFFASADRSRELFRTAAPTTKMDLGASLGHAAPVTLTLPKDFLTLRSTTILSPANTISVSATVQH